MSPAMSPFDTKGVHDGHEYPHVSVSEKSIAGAYFAILWWWNPDGFPEPWDTGFGRYATEDEAASEGRDWAQEEGIPFIDHRETK